MRRLAPRLLACACLLAGAAEAQDKSHPYGLDDLLARQRLGAVTLSPSKSWLVAQSTDPYRTITRFDLLAEADLTVSRLDVVDLKADPKPRRLFANAPDYGYLPGPYSPSGERMAVTRVRGHAMELGVVELATGRAVWTGLTPIVSGIGRTVQWRTEGELIAVTRDPEAPSFIPFYEWQAQARLRAAWTASAEGRLGVTEIGSGRYLGRHAATPPRRLVRIDIASGRVTPLLDADVFDLELSPDRTRVAALSAGEDTPPDPDRVAGLADPFRRQRLTIIDLDDGATWRPWSDHEASPGLLAWSPTGKDLLVLAKRDTQPWGQAAYWRLIPAARDARPLDLHGYAAAPDPDPFGLGAPHGQWMGADPLVLVRPAGAAPAARRHWARLSPRGLVLLGAALPTGADRLVAAASDQIVLGDGQRLWRVGPDGEASPLSASAAPVPSTGLFEGSRVMINERPAPANLVLAVPEPPGALRLAALSRGKIAPTQIAAPAGETLLAAHTDPAVAVALSRDSQGVERVTLRSAGRAPISLLTLNVALEDVAFARPRPIAHRGPHGEALTSWIYLPPSLAPGHRAPLVVVPYPGRIYPAAATGLGPPGRERYPNAQLLAAAGYAVLLPSLPVDEAREPMDGTAERILAVVDAVSASGEPVDTTRLALWGHSYGGYAVLAAATQSDRFKAIISAAPSPDLFIAYAGQNQTLNLIPQAGYPIVNAMGWLESGQARMGAPPWRDPQRYVRNSPALQADKITAPVLLIAGDLDGDPDGPRAMFNALYRQNKDALLLDYHGEGHQMFGVANLRHLYTQALAFLADHIAPDGAVSAATSAGSGAPAP